MKAPDMASGNCEHNVAGDSMIPKGLVGLLGLLFGLCAIFVAVVSAAEAYREHVQARWPETAARIQECSVEPYERSDGSGQIWHIECRITYSVGSEEIAARIRSWSAPRGANIAPLDQWVEDHPRLSSIVVRYDPSNHKHAIPAGTDMPYTGPRTPQNLRLLLMFAVGCAVLVAIARLIPKRPEDELATR